MGGQTLYRIVICGELSERWSEWFDRFDLSLTRGPNGELLTTLCGPVADQAALRGILVALWDLNLTLLSVCRIEAGVGDLS